MTTSAESTTEPTPSVPPTCDVCRTGPSKYRCSRCRQCRYCSIACYKSHQASETSPCVAAVPSEETSASNIDITTTNDQLNRDLLTSRQLNRLGQSSAVKHQLSSQHLRSLLVQIDSAENPGQTLREMMQLPEMQTFAQSCLAVVSNDSMVNLPDLQDDTVAVNAFRELLESHLDS